MNNRYTKPTVVFALLALTTASLAARDEAKLASALKAYNDGLDAATTKLAAAYDKAIDLIKNWDEVQLKEADKKTFLDRLAKEKTQFLASGRLPEHAYGGLLMQRVHYHETLYPLQKQLLSAYEEEIEAFKKRGEALRADLERDYKRLLAEIPNSDRIKVDTVWKGQRHNDIGFRNYYEWTIKSREGDRFSAHVNFIDKHEWIVEGTLNGPLLEAKIAKVVSGQGSTQKFKGVVLGNRMLIGVTINNQSPQVLRLFLQ